MMDVRIIGRGKDNDIVIDDETVSYHHVQISYDGIRFFILDLDSKNGTYVNNRRITDEKQLFLSDSVKIGNTELSWHQYFAQEKTETRTYQPPAGQTEHHTYAGTQQKQRMFQNPFSFSGRIRRSEYGISCILGTIVSYLSTLIAYYIIYENRIVDGGSIFFMILACEFPVNWFMLAQGAKRCHDRNHSGWYQLIPFYGFWMLFADGDYGRNDYGESPKFH